MSDTCTVLTRGANVALPPEVTQVLGVAAWRPAPGVGVDVSALLLSGGRVRDDADFVFYNQPDSDGVHYLGSAAARPALVAAGLDSLAGDGVRVDLSALPAAVDVVVLAASLDEGAARGFGDVSGLHLLLLDETNRRLLARYDLAEAATETALLFGELYRRAGGWRLRAVGQGYDTGLAGLAVDFGVSIDADPAPTEAQSAVPVPAPNGTPSPTPAPATAPAAAPGAVDWAHPPVPASYELPGEGGH